MSDEPQDWQEFKEAVWRYFAPSRKPVTAGQLRRSFNGTFNKPLSDFEKVVGQLLVEGGIRKVASTAGQRASRYSHLESNDFRERSAARPASRSKLSQRELEQALVSRIVGIDQEFALGKWLSVEGILPHIRDLIPRDIEKTLSALAHRFEFLFHDRKPISLRLRGIASKHDYRY